MNTKSLLILLAEVVVIVIIIVAIIKVSTSSQKTPAPAPVQNTNTKTNTNTQGSLTPLVIPFDYRVVSVSTSRVVLNGDKGNLTITNDPKIISVYKGTPTANTPASFTDLKAGNKIKIDAIPGKSIKLYILP